MYFESVVLFVTKEMKSPELLTDNVIFLHVDHTKSKHLFLSTVKKNNSKMNTQKSSNIYMLIKLFNLCLNRQD